jgi:prephenate dehydrogenase
VTAKETWTDSVRDLAGCSVTVVGLGLMGGSLAAALSARRACRRVLGVARRRVTWETARDLRFIDQGTTELREGVAEADIIVLATPVGEIMSTLGIIGPWLAPGSLVMDVGSTKRTICAAMQDLPAGVQPLGGHPMCGKESSGLSVAEPTLYQERVFVLCPLERTSEEALDLGRALVAAIGARPLILDAERHDRAVAAISHLPYLLAVALVNAADDLAQREPLCWQLAAGGFRDTSRLAASDLEMMRDILLTNREPVLQSLQRAQARLGQLESALRDEDVAALMAALQAAHDRRLEVVR